MEEVVNLYARKLEKLSEEELVREYGYNLEQIEEFRERLLFCEDEHNRRNFGRVALRTLWEYGNDEPVA